ncbi:MAG TPA: Clp protease N-terminal domain-containing protein [Acidimicrobiales bacterium]|nr:Clp protease N-terminal domain-containing protein [Acidimicrobiales bacterium]
MEISLEQLIALVEQTSDTPLDRISTAALLQSQIVALGDDLLDHFVTKAREAGMSWAQIGEALGVTRQAAQQRHGPTSTPDPVLEGLRDGRFARFTQRARKAVISAHVEAQARKHGYIGTEHVLLGLMDDPESLASVALTNLGATKEGVSDALRDMVPDGGVEVQGHIPFTPRSKLALENALGEALALGHNYIGTEHILLGLHKVTEGLASRILVDQGVEYEALKGEIITILTRIVTQKQEKGGDD